MSEWYDNRSAEVVLRQPRSWSEERKCLDDCLKLLKPKELNLIRQIFDGRGDQNDQPTFLGVSGLELKKIRSRVATCIKKCLKDAEDKAFPT